MKLIRVFKDYGNISLNISVKLLTSIAIFLFSTGVYLGYFLACFTDLSTFQCQTIYAPSFLHISSFRGNDRLLISASTFYFISSILSAISILLQTRSKIAMTVYCINGSSLVLLSIFNQKTEVNQLPVEAIFSIFYWLFILSLIFLLIYSMIIGCARNTSNWVTLVLFFLYSSVVILYFFIAGIQYYSRSFLTKVQLQYQNLIHLLQALLFLASLINLVVFSWILPGVSLKLTLGSSPRLKEI